MNFGLVFHRIWQKLHCWSRHLKTRRAYCAISLLNYSADLILISWMFSQQPVFLDVLFCISSALIGISITGLYLKRPSVMLPDVIYKVVVSACALFNAILDADNGTSGAAPRLLMVFIALLSHIYENYFLFNAIAAFYREQEGVENRRPPPSYNLFAKSLPKPTELHTPTSAQKCNTSQSNEMENGASTSSASEEPPPTYEFAMEKIKEKKEKEEKNVMEIV
ncbi:hypothetical protein B9Z55_010320 [Caenorhabditis nigoni]|uniref:Uncharacterized protein n=1 Tax=Caenorhabditis nigoni TaxID=1611254 RepID=A0A2G5UFZ2_9PELO|nr:hypothetical protein B9Z55_010320 [Caenorhabditis nigoni]